MSESSTIRWERDEDGVVVLTFDDPDQSVNTMNAAYVASMRATVERLEAERASIAGVVLTSAKPTFFAGADLRELQAATQETLEQVAAFIGEVKDQLRRLETLGVPVVAAIGGSALGGGLEIALAAHHRIALDDARVRIGLPEVTLGLLPAGGGVVRTVRMLGIAAALAHVLLPGTRHRPREAQELGLVDELVAAPQELLPAAKAWIAARAGEPVAQPWDRPGFAIPGGAPADPAFERTLLTLPAQLRRRLKGACYPAPHHIVAAAVEGAQVHVEAALEVEGRWFLDLVTGQVAKSMIQGFFFDMRRAGRAAGRPEGLAPYAARKVVVLGAGMMGAAIAYVCAQAGIDVVLKDVSPEAAERGKGYSRRLVERSVARGRVSQAEGDALLARIHPTADVAEAAGADLLIEAVFEDSALKARVLAEVEPQLAPGALLGSNTSTLPISGLAEHVSRPHDFIGLHFFSPVDKMALLEIVKGKRTSAETLHRALDFARQIGKTPIVVNDRRGFFTSRVIITFINEGIAMLTEGVPPATVEQASAQAGYPAPVLALTDELSLELLRKVRDEARTAAQAAGVEREDHPGELAIDRMLELGRPGRAAGAGFYDYADGRRTRLWPGLAQTFPPARDPAAIDLERLKERMLFVEALETIRCLDEGVLESVADANVGSLLGIGYPGWTGGVLQYVDGYADAARNPDGGPRAFVTRARELASAHGPRFEPPASLVELAERGGRYAEEPARVAEPVA